VRREWDFWNASSVVAGRPGEGPFSKTIRLLSQWFGFTSAQIVEIQTTDTAPTDSFQSQIVRHPDVSVTDQRHNTPPFAKTALSFFIHFKEKEKRGEIFLHEFYTPPNCLFFFLLFHPAGTYTIQTPPPFLAIPHWREKRKRRLGKPLCHFALG
jgi:hypothetical protein